MRILITQKEREREKEGQKETERGRGREREEGRGETEREGGGRERKRQKERGREREREKEGRWMGPSRSPSVLHGSLVIFLLETKANRAAVLLVKQAPVTWSHTSLCQHETFSRW